MSLLRRRLMADMPKSEPKGNVIKVVLRVSMDDSGDAPIFDVAFDISQVKYIRVADLDREFDVNYTLDLASGEYHIEIGLNELTNGDAMFYDVNLLYCDFSDVDISNMYSGKYMFAYTNIDKPPFFSLPDVRLTSNCFEGMFEGCAHLVYAPVLPAKTLVDGCYKYMFNGCTSLVNAPELPATTLSPYCYSYMFYYCTNLNYIKMLATDILATGCLDDWVYGVSPTGTFVKSKDATWDVRGASGIPNGWTVITEDEESGGNSLFPATLIPSIDENIPNYTIAKYFIDTYPDMVVDVNGKYSPIAEDVTIEGSNHCDGKVVGVAKWVNGTSLLFYTENSIANMYALRVFIDYGNLEKGFANEYFFD